MGTVDALLRHDIELNRTTDPSEKLVQALEMMATGIRLKRAALRVARPHVPDTEIDAELERWLFAND